MRIQFVLVSIDIKVLQSTKSRTAQNSVDQPWTVQNSPKQSRTFQNSLEHSTPDAGELETSLVVPGGMSHTEAYLKHPAPICSGFLGIETTATTEKKGLCFQFNRCSILVSGDSRQVLMVMCCTVRMSLWMKESKLIFRDDSCCGVQMQGLPQCTDMFVDVPQLFYS